jgi:lipopolysaccharide transport system ATP-binding protein
MSDIAIRVDNLSKQYRIGGPQVPYRTLRESLSGAIQAPFRRLAAVLRGQPSTVSNDTIWALKDVSFQVQRGEVVGIIGRNGAGKTTLLKVLSRITEPTEGCAEIHGRVGSLLEVGTGFHPELTGRENIYLNGAILGMKKAEIERRFDEIVAFAEIERFLDTPVKRYSSGMYVRLAFAVAAHLEPEILLVDEVLAVGDAAFQKKCLGKMGDVAKEGRTVLFVSHNMSAVRSLCQRAVLLIEGCLAVDGVVESVIQRYAEHMKAPQVVSLQDRLDRRGNGRLRFHSIWLEDEAGQVSPVAASGQTIRIVCTFHNHTYPMQNDVIFSIGIKSMFGEPLLLFRNDYTGQILREVPEHGKVICTIPNFPLMPGVYSLDVYAESAGQVLDWVSSITQLDVIAGDFFGSGKLKHSGFGPFLALHRWDLCDAVSEH